MAKRTSHLIHLGPNSVGVKRKRKREKLPLLSRFFGNPTVDVRRSKRQSRPPQRELQVETGNWEFRQTPRGRGFLLLGLILV